MSMVSCIGPISVTAYSYLFGALIMGLATGIKILIVKDYEDFIFSLQAVEALLFAVVVGRVAFHSFCLLNNTDHLRFW